MFYHTDVSIENVDGQAISTFLFEVTDRPASQVSDHPLRCLTMLFHRKRPVKVLMPTIVLHLGDLVVSWCLNGCQVKNNLELLASQDMTVVGVVDKDENVQAFQFDNPLPARRTYQEMLNRIRSTPPWTVREFEMAAAELHEPFFDAEELSDYIRSTKP